MVTNEVKDLAYGLYGKTPIPVDPEVQKKVLKKYKRGDTPVTVRAADCLEPELEKARDEADGLVRDDYDLLIYALYPSTGEQFLKWKYNIEEKPKEVQPKTLENIQREDEIIAEAMKKIHV
jgi:pyruvate/oxaloacetate carboxyltransferase